MKSFRNSNTNGLKAILEGLGMKFYRDMHPITTKKRLDLAKLSDDPVPFKSTYDLV